LKNTTEIVRSWLEYRSLPNQEWRKDYFSWVTGGYVTTHFLKTRDDMSIPGIVAEVKACHELAATGKRILRLPENILEMIDDIVIDRKPYRDLLKFKLGFDTPRGYPDAYFDGQTWDFKKTNSEKEDTIRQIIKNGRKADNLIFILEKKEKLALISAALKSEYGMRKKDGTWKELPHVYSMLNGRIEIVSI